MKFSELHLNGNVLEALDAMRFEECTPIQEKSIPVILEGRDLIAVAQTGTGKTAAYLLPILNKLSEGGHPADAINCIVMAPTRELAQQIDQQMEGFSYFMSVSSVAVYGGNDGILFEQQKRGLTLGADVVIATPGRLIAHLSLGYVDLSRVSYFILDEADRMLDMGFYDDIMQIVKFLPKERQTIMFSATMPAKIQQLAGNILNNPAEVKLAVSKPAEKIVQAAYVCYENQKLGIIRSLFAEETPERVIIFASSKLKVKEVTKALKQMKLNVGEMHSDLEQAQREEVMYEFKAGRINILVATDIVARGIDIDDIRLVINYDVPHDSEDYVHRIGRTARANNDGVPSPSFPKRSRGTLRISKNSWIGTSIRYRFPKSWVKHPNTSREHLTEEEDGAAMETDVSQEETRTAVTTIKAESPGPNVHRMAVRRNKHCGEEKADLFRFFYVHCIVKTNNHIYQIVYGTFGYAEGCLIMVPLTIHTHEIHIGKNGLVQHFGREYIRKHLFSDVLAIKHLLPFVYTDVDYIIIIHIVHTDSIFRIGSLENLHL